MPSLWGRYCITRIARYAVIARKMVVQPLCTSTTAIHIQIEIVSRANDHRRYGIPCLLPEMERNPVVNEVCEVYLQGLTCVWSGAVSQTKPGFEGCTLPL
jgi:hypothetical protein